MKRRRFIHASVSCSALTVLPSCSNDYQQCEQNARGELVLSRPQFELARGARPFLLLENPASRYPVSLWQQAEDHFSACLMKCAHQACQTSPRITAQGGLYACPCHGSQYDIDGSLRRGPATSDLDQYTVRVEGEQIIIAASTAT